MRLVTRLASRAFRALTTQRIRHILASWIAELGDVDLLSISHHSMGIMKFKNLRVSGEEHLVRRVLPRIVTRAQPIFFDVGASVGEYSLLLREVFPSAEIYAFEPVASTFIQLVKQLGNLGVHCEHIGFGDKPGTATIHLGPDETTSPFATLYEEVLKSAHGLRGLRAETIHISTLDDYCSERGIDAIDLLKVDTEGHEMQVLMGCRNLLERGRVGIIEFEFNEMNVYSRVFLRDFFQFLPRYSLFRLDTARLIPLEPYHPRDEIFRFQNIVAIDRAVHP